MDTFYARHTLGLCVDKSTKQRLSDDSLIGVHYPEFADGKEGNIDNRSLDPADYAKRAKEIMQTLTTLAKNGGYVCVEYQDQQCAKIGIVPPNSRITLLEGQYADSNRVAVLKTLQIAGARPLDPWTATRVLAGRPQRHTLCTWSAVRDRIKRLVEGSDPIRTVSDLLPAEQEILCSEFLRLPLAEDIGVPRLSSLLSPIGRTMKDLDIVGLDAQSRVIAGQVTHSRIDEAPAKLETMRRYANTSKCVPILFCMSEDNYRDGDVHVVSLEYVFAEFTATNIGKSWLAAITAPVSSESA
jgi:hypothetical protein